MGNAKGVVSDGIVGTASADRDPVAFVAPVEGLSVVGGRTSLGRTRNSSLNLVNGRLCFVKFF